MWSDLKPQSPPPHAHATAQKPSTFATARAVSQTGASSSPPPATGLGTHPEAAATHAASAAVLERDSGIEPILAEADHATSVPDRAPRLRSGSRRHTVTQRRLPIGRVQEPGSSSRHDLPPSPDDPARLGRGGGADARGLSQPTTKEQGSHDIVKIERALAAGPAVEARSRSPRP